MKKRQYVDSGDYWRLPAFLETVLTVHKDSRTATYKDAWDDHKVLAEMKKIFGDKININHVKACRQDNFGPFWRHNATTLPSDVLERLASLETRLQVVEDIEDTEVKTAIEKLKADVRLLQGEINRVWGAINNRGINGAGLTQDSGGADSPLRQPARSLPGSTT